MTKIKICGLSRACDIDFVNEARPDYCGFILNVPGSRRSISIPLLLTLCSHLDRSIIPVGVFVNASKELLLPLLKEQVLGAVQLHGTETPDDIRALKEHCSVPIIKAFSIRSPEDIRGAEESPADLILLDHGSGGTGKTFDWSLLSDIRRPYILAGGLDPGNLPKALQTLAPYGVDLSSGLETNGYKDREKILAAVAAVRRKNE